MDGRLPHLVEDRVYDCVVVGGGPAGCAAAWAAASAGCATVLVERHGFLGGMGTAASLSCFINFRHRNRDLSGRFYRSVLGALAAGRATYSAENGNADIFEPEALKWELEGKLHRAGVVIAYHATIAAAAASKAGWRLKVFHKSGDYRIAARCAIDATGDADLAVKAGAPLTYGRKSDGLAQPLTAVVQLGGAHPDTFARAGGNLVEGRFIFGSNALGDQIARARQAGEWSIPRNNVAMLWSMPWDPTRVSVNGTRILGASACQVAGLSRGESEGRRQARELASLFAKYVPGFERSYLFQTGPQIGVRESRRIVGRATLTEEDVLASRKPHDSVAYCAYPIDLHSPVDRRTEFDPASSSHCYGIPYGCLQPKGIDNLLAAGRCIGASHEAAGSFRVMPTCMNLGEAAGAAVALARSAGISVNQIQGEQVAELVTDHIVEEVRAMR